MAANRRFADLTRTLVERSVLRAKSLIVTVYGDAIAPHGGTVWLGSLIRLVAPFGLNERLVRTAVLRLSRDHWLSATQIGRRSYYSLTDSGRRRFEDAHRRIYAVPNQSWNGEWTLAFLGLNGMAPTARDRIRRELGWQGFGAVAPNCLAHPAADIEAVRHVLQDHDASHQVVLMEAAGLGARTSEAMFDLVRQCWDIDKLAIGYREFLARFRPLYQAAESEGEPDPESCFLVRTLLIHEYRRVLLRDPQLPDELLPADWTGTAARSLCRNLYRLTEGAAESHLMAKLETADGPLPDAAPFYYRRFGGLDDRSVSSRPAPAASSA